ncbi:hypothetical protein [Corynebacterium macclintockiae]|uniref:hypothetical protein n=1 Tax=Corynebacterium macclintockiae TaxID=2913501 RepID=UPI003EBA30B1
MSSPSDVWSASDYAPTAARLRPISELVAAELARRLPTLGLPANRGHVVELPSS